MMGPAGFGASFKLKLLERISGPALCDVLLVVD
jgi:hypothetical protein